MDFSALVKELEIEKLPFEEQQAIINSVLDTVMQNVGLRLDMILTPEQKDAMDKIATEQGGEAAAQELLRIYPDYPKLYQEELDKLKDFLKKVKDQKEAMQPNISKPEGQQQ